MVKKEYFNYQHLPEHIKEISKKVSELRDYMDENLIDSAEKTTGMRKLLEAKDCFVRAKL